MNFNSHSHLKDQHAYLGASKYHWVNYDEEKLINSYAKFQASQRGTRLHAVAKELIDLGIKLPKTRKTFNMYVNDAIGFQMKTEQILYYSDNCFGTADAIKFQSNLLRIHDLKNGDSPANIKQLKIYEAIFCLEYGFNPKDIEAELRLYQSDDVQIERPDPEEILYIMGKIIDFDKRIEQIKIGG